MDVEDYRQAVEKEKGEPANVVVANFELENPEIEETEKDFGKGVFSSRIVQVKRGYANKTTPTVFGTVPRIQKKLESSLKAPQKQMKKSS